MHYRLELETESACHDLRHVRQSVWQLHLHIHLCREALNHAAIIRNAAIIMPRGTQHKDIYIQGS